jgi:hypothetical protein
MAYSDYGGYAYRNGERVTERSDTVLTTGGIKSTPGQWPGWTIPEGRGGGAYHALLGDGPIYVGLYKQSILTIHRLGEELDPVPLLRERRDDDHFQYNGQNGLSSCPWQDSDRPCVLEVDGHRVEAFWTTLATEDNHYVYARLTQPDGTVWTGFSGYGVGAGLEGAGYGYSTRQREDTLRRLFPPRGTPGFTPEQREALAVVIDAAREHVQATSALAGQHPEWNRRTLAAIDTLRALTERQAQDEQ